MARPSDSDIPTYAELGPLQDPALAGSVAEPKSPVDAFDLGERIKLVPTEPGVYLMKDRAGRIVYVGKARSLKARLRNYLTGSDTRFFVGLLQQVLGDVEVIVTRNEKEALLLENELIKAHQPRFNVELKDDKNFLHIRIAKDQDYPRLEVVRRPRKDGALYFGPYHSATAIRATIRLVNRHFRLRTCRESVFKNRVRPCLEYQIHRCPGPCVLSVPVAQYADDVREVVLFLEGRASELTDALTAKMKLAARDEHFELAAHYRDQIRAVNDSLETQHVVLDPGTGRPRDRDVLGFKREGARVIVSVLAIRSGTLLGAESYALREQEFPDEEVLSGFVARLYGDGRRAIPDEIVLPFDVEDARVREEWLTEIRAKEGRTRVVRIVAPRRGDLARLLEIAQKNADQAFDERMRGGDTLRATLLGLQKRLHLASVPRRMECFDISNIQGTDNVASMAVFIDGEPAKAEYRTFKIKGVEGANDFASMYEVLSRRFSRAIDEDSFPDLVVIDGGKGQLHMAEKALEDLGVFDVDIVSLAKARAIDVDANMAPERSAERVFIRGAKNAIIMPQNSNEVFLLTRLRDEAHRFAITFHRAQRTKRTLASKLDDIAGVGEARKKALLERFGSVRRIREASVDDVASVPGIGSETAARIKRVLGGVAGMEG